MKKTIASAIDAPVFSQKHTLQEKLIKCIKKDLSPSNVASLIESEQKKIQPKHYQQLIKIMVKYQDKHIENALKKITHRETPYGHYRWLLRQQLTIKKTEKRTAKKNTQILILDWVFRNIAPNKKKLLEHISNSQVKIPYLNMWPATEKETDELKKTLSHHFLKTSSSNEWLSKNNAFDEKNHFKTLTATCHTGETHTLHIQCHSGPHIHGYSGELKNTGSKKKKSRFNASILSANNLDYLQKVWKTFDPNIYDQRISKTTNSGCIYWNVNCQEDLSGNKDTIFTMQVSLIDEGIYSIHVHPNKKCRVDATL